MEVRVEIVGGRIAAMPFPNKRFPGDKEMSKSIPGHRWNKEQRYWHYPLTLASCRILRETYSDMLVIGPNLAAWARAEIQRSNDMARLAASSDTELQRLPEVAPDLYAAMSSRTYQRVGARFLAENRSILLADEPTLGKTIQYLGGLIEGNNEEGLHLVVAPKTSLYSTWANEVFKWTDFHPFWVPDGREKRERLIDLFLNDEHPSKFLIINPEMLQVLRAHWCNKCEKWAPTDAEDKATRRTGKRWYPDEHYTEAHNTVLKIKKQDWPILTSLEWASICIDEAHMSLLGNRGGKKTQTAEGFNMLRLRDGGMRVASTGTPLRGNALSFWSIFNWLDSKTWSSRWAFAESFLEWEDNRYTQSGKTFLSTVRPDREQALNEVLKPIMLRRTKKEVQPDLPDDVYVDHWVELEGKHKQQYEGMVLEGEAEIEGGALSTNGILAEHTRRKQFAFGAWKNAGGKLIPDAVSSPKLELLLSLLAERGVTGDPETEFRLEGAHKYIVTSQFTTIVDFLEEEFNKRGIFSVKITGAVTSKRREEVVEDWQNDADHARVLFMNTKAGGTSLTLDAMCDEMFILDETWMSDDQFQVFGRIRNRDVEKRVATRFCHYIRTRETIEEEIADSGLTQEEFQKTLLDRSRGHNVKRREIKK